jgi:hypothetical protein
LSGEISPEQSVGERERRKEARKRYQLERNGVVATGWKKARKVAKRV